MSNSIEKAAASSDRHSMQSTTAIGGEVLKMEYRDLFDDILKLLPYLRKKKKVIVGGSVLSVNKMIKKELEKIFFRGLIVDELIEIETEIEDILLNKKFGKYSEETKEKRDMYREQKLRKNGEPENKFENKVMELRRIVHSYLKKDEQDKLSAQLSKIEEYRHLFAHREIKYDSNLELNLYCEQRKKERIIKINLNFIRLLLKEVSEIKSFLKEIKRAQENGK